MSGEISTIFVDKFYTMDPEFDDLLATGDLIQEGMVVLIEASLLRADTERKLERYDLDRAREMNQWCVVSDVVVTARFESSYSLFSESSGRPTSPLVSFIATYPDGHKRKRQFDVSYAWLVKRGTGEARR